MDTSASQDQAVALLEREGINKTRPRLLIASLLFARHQHVSAPELYRLAQETDPDISRTTVYNTLELFCEHGLVQEVSLEDGHRIYDTNSEPHHHLYHEDTGKIEDLDEEQISVHVPDSVLGKSTLTGVDVTVRVRG